MNKLLGIILCTLLIATPAWSQSVTGIISAIDHNEYASVAAQFRITSLKVGGQTIYNGSGYLFCADLIGKSLDEDSSIYPRVAPNLTLGTMEQMEIWSRFTNQQDQAYAIAMAHWFIDNYYVSSFLSPQNNVSARQYAFQSVIWEIFGDGGTSSGLNFNNGNINRSKFGPYGSDSDSTLWGYMNTMLNGVKTSGVTSAYNEKIEVLVALDPRSTYQDYLLVSAAVPEPSATAVAMIGALLLLARRRR